MPLYEYMCEDCDKEFEELVFGDPAVLCPHCGSARTDKLMSRCRHKRGGASEPVGTAAAAGSGAGSSCSGCAASSCAGCR
ncbi:MAG: zinc ribbon domain-containing protein [Desulfovibrionales bacterium]|nr:MAG: zinc ribbon domain-containing protein [Desulfovibrionales bacterium]